MYSLILNNNRLVMAVTKELKQLGDGLISVSETYRFSKNSYSDIIEVDDIPTDYEDMKYIISETGEFSISNEWIEPDLLVNPAQLQKSVDLLQEENLNIMLASAEMYELQSLENLNLMTAIAELYEMNPEV